MIHYCDADNDWDTIKANGIIDYAKQLKAEGKIRHIGLSSHNPKQLAESFAYCDLPEEEKAYAEAFAAFPRVSWSGHCMYCTHCHPCPAEINIADVTKFLNLVIAHNETRCPFEVDIRANMRRAKEIFGY